MIDYRTGQTALIFTRHDSNPCRATRVDCDGIGHWQEAHGLLRHDSEVTRVIVPHRVQFTRAIHKVVFGKRVPALRSC